MRKTLLFFSLLCTISILWGTSPGLAAGCAITVSGPGAGSFSTGSNVTLTAVVSGACQPIVQMAFYNGSTLLGTSNSSPYTFIWNTTGLATGTYNDIYAVAAFAGVGAPPSNSAPKVIDMVGSPSFGPNPAADPSFGEGGSGSWVQGDNQMCSSSVPYNGATPVFPDGTCEWTGSATVPSSATPALNSTVDSLDDTMHTLSFLPINPVFELVVLANSLRRQLPFFAERHKSHPKRIS